MDVYTSEAVGSAISLIRELLWWAAGTSLALRSAPHMHVGTVHLGMPCVNQGVAALKLDLLDLWKGSAPRVRIPVGW